MVKNYVKGCVNNEEVMQLSIIDFILLSVLFIPYLLIDYINLLIKLGQIV